MTLSDQTSPADPTAPPAPAEQAPADQAPAPSQPDPRDAELEQLRAELARRDAADAASPAPQSAPAPTASVSPAEPVEDYKPAVRDLVDFTAEDPLTGASISGVGLVVDATAKHALVAPLSVLHLPVTELAPRHDG